MLNVAVENGGKTPDFPFFSEKKHSAA